ncbi:MAG TPA: fibronectin type III domain-containing protein, partial [Candidatus Binatia bacterium]|nr:fibronectin type III domain-containing protein [Candidatus Binatia bacterium]
MDHAGCVRRLSRLCLLPLVAALCVVPLGASTIVHLSWDANSEPDLSGYRLLYGTSSGNYTNTIEIGNLTNYDVIDLASGTTYYFVVVAYDLAGNVSLRSNEVSAQPIVLAPLPTISVTDSPDPVAAGSTITYTIAYANAGTVTATGVILADGVPANTTFVAATGGGTLSGGVVTWSPGTLAPG